MAASPRHRRARLPLLSRTVRRRATPGYRLQAAPYPGEPPGYRRQAAPCAGEPRRVPPESRAATPESHSSRQIAARAVVLSRLNAKGVGGWRRRHPESVIRKNATHCLLVAGEQFGIFDTARVSSEFIFKRWNIFYIFLVVCQLLNPTK